MGGIFCCRGFTLRSSRVQYILLGITTRIMNKILVISGFIGVMLGFASPALANTYAYNPHVVTAPYWCGSYYSSYPCGYQPYQPYLYQNQYPNQYPNYYQNYQ